ncbi:MAG: Gfo/Idh/MocA family oxidoreductase [Caldilineaceae bacterium]|nr:Gfo/Idh/MocA family oxidoreductase [Caldilinea sp.]MCB0068363.1 Gfo/Idh/MocA family oxidoreductase [Caldilineaceae bacterium]MCB0135858.1 Gfo/Idh/MocA family oxidoreductase [Caldilineaceae bacterium]HRW49625.1 Gfo/Idh/MocA family oxidoreductase [Caldilinea sp.]
MQESKLRVAVLGAGAWANFAHIPGWLRDPRCELVAICDPVDDRARDFAANFGVARSTTDWQEIVGDPTIDVIDVCTPSSTHFELAWAGLEAGKHVLCEKPVAYDYRETRRAADLARSKGLKTKLGFTFRYSPGVQYARALIDEGFTGRPLIFNGYEQNSQWLDPMTPLRQVDIHADQSVIQTSSLEGYGAPVIDISHWWVGADLQRVVGTMRNFIPERMVRDTGRMMRMNIDDGDIYIGEFTNGALTSIQTSFVTIGNYPGIEARLYGEKGAIICRLVEEFGVAETIKIATPDAVEFKEMEIPQRFYPPGGHARESWRSLFYANLIRDFIDEILDGGERNQGNFDDGAWVQETINAVERSFHEERWVHLPLEGDVA